MGRFAVCWLVLLALSASTARACAAHDASPLLDVAAAIETREAASDVEALLPEAVDDNAVGGCGCGGHGRDKAVPRKTHLLVPAVAEAAEAAEAEAAKEATAHATSAGKPETEAARVLIPAGRFHMGTDGDAIPGDGEGPARWVEVAKPYYMDTTEVTNARFAEFVAATGHKTDAEKYGWSFVFQPQLSPETDAKATEAVKGSPWWLKVEGANWAHPYGPDSDTAALADHPVVHVSFNDGEAYCKWNGGRLPTEKEWERAARGGVEDELFPWGNDLTAGGAHHCNIWQGTFPDVNTAEDGWQFTAPVRSFEPNAYGLHEMIGNVWEWTRSPFGRSSRDILATRGGSFLCHASYCYRYRNSARTRNEPDSSTSNMGFRCVYPVD